MTSSTSPVERTAFRSLMTVACCQSERASTYASGVAAGIAFFIAALCASCRETSATPPASSRGIDSPYKSLESIDLIAARPVASGAAWILSHGYDFAGKPDGGNHMATRASVKDDDKYEAL